MTTVETAVWEQAPDRPAGYLRRARIKTVVEVFGELQAIVGDLSEDCDEYFKPAFDSPVLWPDGRLVVFAVTGGSEGHYIHVEVHGDDGHRQTVILGKTFAGWDASWRFAKRLARILNV